MIENAERQKIIDLVKAEVVPAIGCTEPIAVALCVAKAARALGCVPEKIEVLASANIIKNAMGVGIPGTGMIGLPIAIALGALIGKPELDLEVLRDVTDDDVDAGRRMIAERRIDIGLKTGIAEKLYVEACLTAPDGATATAIISGGHTNFVYAEARGTVLLDRRQPQSSDCARANDAPTLTLAKVWEFTMETPIEELRFILDTRRVNKAAAEQSFTGRYGHSVGRTLHCERQRYVMGDSIFSRILSYTSAACDARMAGACIPVMSNSGSGNQGIAATLPVVIYAEESFASEEQTVRALMLSHLTAIYIKQNLGRLSALCGCVVAATGSSCGIAYLMGGGYEQISATVKNMVANLTGMICDGAKPSCAMKLTSGVSTAVISAIMAMEGHGVTSVEGIIDDDVDQTIRNFAHIGRDGMDQTDQIVLRIMTAK
ncbi:MAG: L-serine ammonia-lyase, iron-sulfur-dependent, subunit alpha [Muribaculaceae bacterium]|nr:L-serine ammonia-lyase, iron-sulfur-dependent, subunit alpha [Muribaculaceae bacterium]